MHEQNPPYEIIENHGCFSQINCQKHTSHWGRCFNLIQNPSFEVGLTSWVTDNVSITDTNPFEGTQVARMDTGISTIYQDVSLTDVPQCPLLLSFTITGGEDDENRVPNILVEIIWLDGEQNALANGLRLLIPRALIGRNTRFTYLAVTDQPPAAANWARLQFSKAPGQNGEDLAELDQIILTPISSGNLLENPSFEIGLAGWISNNFLSNFIDSFEGTAQVTTTIDGSIYQDVPINNFPIHSSFLLAFVAKAVQTAALSAQILWLDRSGNQIGSPGLSLNIPNSPLNYLSYLDVTTPAPTGAVTARVLFSADVQTGASLALDHVILARTDTRNLVQNPSFEANLAGWVPVNTAAITTTQAYEGTKTASLAENGGALYQDVAIANSTGRCFLFSFGLKYSAGTSIAFLGNVLIKLIWLDDRDREIGLGLTLLVPRNSPRSSVWQVYNSVSDPAPTGAVKARLQFSKTASTGGTIEIDKVVLASLD